MALFNHLSQRSRGLLVLQTIPSYWLRILGFCKVLFLVFGIFIILSTFVWPSELARFGVISSYKGIVTGISLVVMGQITSFLLTIVRQMSITFIFDITRQELQIDMKAFGLYEFLPKSIPLSQLRTLRLRRVERTRSVSHWLLEVITEKDMFIPLTFFRSESKARRIAQALQRSLQLSLVEDSMSGYSFSSYKADFLAQFQDQSAQNTSLDPA